MEFTAFSISNLLVIYNLILKPFTLSLLQETSLFYSLLFNYFYIFTQPLLSIPL
ncbi:hypothetical protein U3516DRAFT_885420 [Neocallimastix sp. 'constans']